MPNFSALSRKQEHNFSTWGLSSKLAADPQGHLPHSTLRTGAGEVGAVRFASRRNDQEDRTHPPLGYLQSPRSTCFRLLGIRGRTVAIASHRASIPHSVQEEGASVAGPCIGRKRYRDPACSWATMVPFDGLRVRYLGVGGRRLTTTLIWYIQRTSWILN